MKPDIRKHSGNAAEGATLTLPAYREHCVTLETQAVPSSRQSLWEFANEPKATLLNQFVFGDLLPTSQRQSRAATDWQVAWLAHDARSRGVPFSSQATILSGLDTTPVVVDGRNVGLYYEDGDARYCRLAGLLPLNLQAPRDEQTRSVFECMERALEQAGMTFTDTVRTWFYMDRLLEWYGEFNRVRTTFFEKAGVFAKMVPASTGIGAANAAGAALTAGLLAVQPKQGRVTVKAVPSPLQCSARDYGSSFSRAVEVGCPTHRTLYVSGTASIDPQGRSARPDDPAGEIEYTMQVVDALLKSRGMDWDDAFRGIVYYTRFEYDQLFREYCVRRGIPAFPLARSCADVCRSDLLFEIELDAVALT